MVHATERDYLLGYWGAIIENPDLRNNRNKVPNAINTCSGLDGGYHRYMERNELSMSVCLSLETKLRIWRSLIDNWDEYNARLSVLWHDRMQTFETMLSTQNIPLASSKNQLEQVLSVMREIWNIYTHDNANQPDNANQHANQPDNANQHTNQHANDNANQHTNQHANDNANQQHE